MEMKNKGKCTVTTYMSHGSNMQQGLPVSQKTGRNTAVIAQKNAKAFTLLMKPLNPEKLSITSEDRHTEVQVELFTSLAA